MIDDFVNKHTVQTIREWFTVEDEDLDERDPDIYVYVVSPFAKEMKKVTRRLCQEDVDLWVSHWWMEAPRSNRSRAPDGIEPNITLPPLDGVVEHHRRLERLRKRKEEKEQSARERRQQEGEGMIEQLEVVANTPVDYGSDSDTFVAVNEDSIYPAYTAQLREHGLDESSVFDMVVQLSTLVQQSRQILPRLTAEIVQQFEARVLLSYYRKHRQERGWTQAAKDKEVTEKESYKEMQRIYIQLLNLSIALSSRTDDDSGIKWLDIISGMTNGVIHDITGH